LEKIMPIYEYACPGCRHVFENWLKLSETTENAVCPKCGSRAQRIISHTSFVLKGGGWYVTDYGYRKGASEDGLSAASDAATSSTPAASDGSGQSADSAPATVVPSRPVSGAASDACA
jgi:putative FmdB family regulatory protein